MSRAGEIEEAMFWRMMREALYDDLAGKPPAKLNLSERQIAEICFRYAHGEHQYTLAKEFGVSQPTISDHVKGVVRLCGRGTGIRAIQAAGCVEARAA